MDEAYTTAQTNIDLSANQNVTMEILYHTVRFWGASILVNAMSSPPNLLAMDNLEQYIQTELPDNQWQIEVQNWHATALVNIQDRLVLQVVGPQNPEARQFVDLPATDAEAAICKAQRVRVAQGFNNISLFGLVFVLSFGLVITLLGVFLTDVASLFGRVSHKLADSQQSWIRDDVLQIQRLAYQGQGNEVWAKTDKEIPVTSAGGLLGPLRDDVTSGLVTVKTAGSDTSKWEVDSLIHYDPTLSP